MKNIFLIGFMGTGKSTIANALQKEFGLQVLEMDEQIAEQEKMSISDIFKTKGEAYFRDLETLFLKNMKEQSECVVSCGGGVVLREENVEEMRRSGCVVLLTAEPETILERVKRSNGRPILEGNKTVEFITQLMEQRKEKYELAAEMIVHTDGKTACEIAKVIMKKVKEDGEE